METGLLLYDSLLSTNLDHCLTEKGDNNNNNNDNHNRINKNSDNKLNVILQMNNSWNNAA